MFLTIEWTASEVLTDTHDTASRIAVLLIPWAIGRDVLGQIGGIDLSTAVTSLCDLPDYVAQSGNKGSFVANANIQLDIV